jgi:aspartyl-tRNA synthetase
MKHLEDIAKTLGTEGLVCITVGNWQWKSPILKIVADGENPILAKELDMAEGAIIFLSSDKWERGCTILGRTRLECRDLAIANDKMVIPADQFGFRLVIDFPLMTFDEEYARFIATYHPFTASVPEDVKLLKSDPQNVRGQHDDVVVHGMELGRGSVRIHQPQLQEYIFNETLKIPENVVNDRFGYMLKTFKFRAPPHGGMALGLDR